LAFCSLLAGASALATASIGCITGDDPLPRPRADGQPDAGSRPRDAGPDPIRDATVEEDASDPPDAEAPVGRIEGQVLDLSQHELGVVPDIDVRVVGGAATKSDKNGRFVLENVAAGRPVRLRVSTDDIELGAVDTELLVTVVPNGTTQVFPRILRDCVTTIEVQGDAGTITADLRESRCGQHSSRAATVQIPRGALRTAAGQPFEGFARVSLTPVAAGVFNRNETFSFPWYATVPGVPAGLDAAGRPTALEALGALRIAVSDGATGAALSLAPGASVVVSMQVMRVPEAPESPSAVRAWRFDDSRGLWVEGPAGAFAELPSDEESFSVFRFEVSTLGWFVSALPVATPTCIRGTVKAAGGAALEGAELRANGARYGGSTSARTSAGGAFCVNVKPPSEDEAQNVDLVALANVAGQRFRGTKRVRAGENPGLCETNAAACTDVGEVEVSPDAPWCLRTKFTGAGDPNVPYTSEVEVYASSPFEASFGGLGERNEVYLGTLRGGADGRFCTPLPRADSYFFSGEAPVGDCGDPFARVFSYVDDRAPEPGTCSSAVEGQGCIAPEEVVLGCDFSQVQSRQRDVGRSAPALRSLAR
jgi:hypothetical protein